MRAALAHSPEVIDIAATQIDAVAAGHGTTGRGDTPAGTARVTRIPSSPAAIIRQAAAPAGAGAVRVAERPAPAEVMCTWVKVGNIWQCL